MDGSRGLRGLGSPQSEAMPLDTAAFAAWQRVLQGPEQEREGALAELAILAQREPPDPDVIHVYGQGVASRGRPADAIGPLTAALELRPDEWQWRLELADLYRRIGEHELAAAELRAVADAAPADDERAAARAGLEDLRVLDEQQALHRRQIAVLREWVRTDRGGERAAVVLARRLTEFGMTQSDRTQLEEAATVLEHARATHGDSAAILEGLVPCYEVLDRSRLRRVAHALEAVAPESPLLDILGDPEVSGALAEGIEEAERAYRKAYLLEREEDLAGAITAYQQAIDSGDPEHAPAAAVNLGNLLARRGDVPGARAAYEVAIDSRHADARPKALRALGNVLAGHGDRAGAEAAYGEAIATGHNDQAPKAALNLGHLLEQHGDDEGARAAYAWAIEAGDPAQSSEASLALGIMLHKAGDFDDARELYEYAMRAAEPEIAAPAGLNLAALAERAGDVDAAEMGLKWAAYARHEDLSPRAALRLGYLHAEKFEWDEMVEAYSQAMSSGHPEAAPAAARQLGFFRAHRSEVDEARVALQYAIDSGHAEHAAPAALRLGQLLEDNDDFDGAIGAYRAASDAADAEIRGEAERSLAWCVEMVRAKRLLDDD
jgi:Tfp pilus assembly protein PilF